MNCTHAVWNRRQHELRSRSGSSKAWRRTTLAARTSRQRRAAESKAAEAAHDPLQAQHGVGARHPPVLYARASVGILGRGCAPQRPPVLQAEVSLRPAVCLPPLTVAARSSTREASLPMRVPTCPAPPSLASPMPRSCSSPPPTASRSAPS